jgi:hypothetical protein
MNLLNRLLLEKRLKLRVVEAEGLCKYLTDEGFKCNKDTYTKGPIVIDVDWRATWINEDAVVFTKRERKIYLCQK